VATFKAVSSYAISGTFADTSLDHTEPTARIGKKLSQTWTSGTGANQANQWFADRRTVTAASENLDMFGGLTDALGVTINFATIREIVILNRSTTTAEILTISGTALTNILGGTSPTVKIGPGGKWVQGSPIDGFTITDTSADVLTIDPGAATITYDIFIIGTV